MAVRLARAFNTTPQFWLNLQSNHDFYSKRKNTAEMLKMLEILVKKYRDEDRIYLSWDASFWHASKEFKTVDAINA